MTEKVTVRCNWTQSAGHELSDLVPTRIFDEDVFEKPDLDDVVNEERAVLFSNTDCPTTPCELRFQISPRFKIVAVTLVCSTPKVELFMGPTEEYLETVYGIAIEDDGDIPIKPYRYDVEIERSGIADINLKLLTSATEICVYGAMLHIAPNPNGITTQMQTFDLQKIQELLHKGGSSSITENQPAVENEEKFQKFMSLMKGFTGHSQTELKTAPDIDTNSITQYIDMKFEAIERTILKRLDEFEAQQTKKLDKIIAMLETK